MLLFYGMSDKNVILHEEITSSQADAVSVVGSARTHFAMSINLHVPLKKNFCGYGFRDFGNPGEVLEMLVVADHGGIVEDAGNKEASKVRVSMLFLVLPRCRSPGLTCRVPFSQRLSEVEDWRDRICLNVFLTPLDLRNVTLQIFIPH